MINPDILSAEEAVATAALRDFSANPYCRPTYAPPYRPLTCAWCKQEERETHTPFCPWWRNRQRAALLASHEALRAALEAERAAGKRLREALEWAIDNLSHSDRCAANFLGGKTALPCDCGLTGEREYLEAALTPTTPPIEARGEEGL